MTTRKSLATTIHDAIDDVATTVEDVHKQVADVPLEVLGEITSLKGALDRRGVRPHPHREQARAAADDGHRAALGVSPGDCTVHFGDVMHAALPPTGSGPGRRALYLSCMPERAFRFIPPGKSYNDVILVREGGMRP